MTRRPEITLTQLRYFIEAAQCLSMTQAAAHLLVAQSAVSAAVAQLEAQVGAQLFIRQRSKGLVLTAAGQQLVGDARVLMANLDEALDAARGLDNQVRGTVRLACFVTLAPFILPAIVSRVQEEYPHLVVEVEELDSEGTRDALRTGRAELAVGYDFAFGDDIRKEVVGEAPAHIVLPVGHPLAARSRIPLRELARERMILLDLPHSREYFLAILAGVGVEPDIRHRSESYETVRSFVAQGHGFSILNQRPVSDTTYDGHTVVTRPIADEVPALSMVLATLKSVRTTARARAVGEIIRVVVAERSQALAH
ncbi:LysR family transcriptional regulator [Frondihabitans cladoniiphilus]|uniref:LysR family transcriptional regulator n=1 Tax=Frondihabitans cladoniiphilus TaxID=715785 RepID=A0ABP8VHM5_9MICO